MRAAGYKLLDCQFMTSHLESLGAIEIPQAEYLEKTSAAKGQPAITLAQAFEQYALGADHSSPGKVIAQSFTQTS
jgi:leucyl/phenylalanyl-tRNA--protein transferase